MKSICAPFQPSLYREEKENFNLTSQLSLQWVNSQERNQAMEAIIMTKKLGMEFAPAYSHLSQKLPVGLVKELTGVLTSMCEEYENIFQVLKDKNAQHEADSLRLKRRLEEVVKQGNALNKELVLSNKQKDLLLEENHHRVKNNFHLINSLFELQMRRISGTSTKAILLDSKSRVRSISLIHDQLYDLGKESEISLRSYLQNLVGNINDAFRNDDLTVCVNLDIDDSQISMKQTTPFGLVVNELLMNVYKHAFKGRENGTVTIIAKVEKNQCSFEIIDNGVGLPNQFEDKKGSLGCCLIKGLAKQLYADLEFISLEKGTKVRLEFPLQ